MTALLLSLLEEYNRNVQIGLPSSQLSVCASNEDLEGILGHFMREGVVETEEFLIHSLDVAQYQVMEQQMLWEDLDKFIKDYSAQVDPSNQVFAPSLYTDQLTHDSSGYLSEFKDNLLPLAPVRHSPPQPKYPMSNNSLSSTPPPHTQQMMNTSTKKRQNFPREVTQILMEWLIAHYDHPYPSEQEKEALGQRVGLKVSQICGWFINARRRKLKKDATTNTFNLFKTK